jgi:hypothetical protein
MEVFGRHKLSFLLDIYPGVKLPGSQAILGFTWGSVPDGFPVWEDRVTISYSGQRD